MIICRYTTTLHGAGHKKPTTSVRTFRRCVDRYRRHHRAGTFVLSIAGTAVTGKPRSTQLEQQDCPRTGRKRDSRFQKDADTIMGFGIPVSKNHPARRNIPAKSPDFIENQVESRKPV